MKFDAQVVERVGEELLAALGLHQPLHVEIDETTPLGRVRAAVNSA